MDRRFYPVFALVLIAGFVWTATSAEKPTGKRQSTQTSSLGESLGGGDRYLTYVSTDKPIYRPGETLYMRGVPLHYITRKPITTGRALQAIIEIKGPKGDTVASGVSRLQESVFGFSWPIPPSQAGGEYTIRVTDPYTGQPPAERKFDVRAYRAPRLKTQIKFIRDGYGAGDEVVASLHAERAEGGVPAGSAVTVIARVDGTETFRGPAQIDDKGNCLARFKLPPEIRRGEGTLAMVIEDGGVVETASKTIPILLQTVDLSMYPEGGELVAGLVNRVYFEAFTPARKPADLAGVVLDADGKEVARFRSQHEGRGRFTLTPAIGGKYTLKITEPSGIKTHYELPPVRSSGVVLTALQEVTAKGEDVRISLAAAEAGVYRVVLQQRELEVAMQQAELAAGGSKELAFSLGAADGVLRVTVWNAEGKPLAERLIFRQPAHSVQVKLSADAKQYVPGSNAKISVQTCDETGHPVSAVVGITATDDSVLEMIDKREQTPRLPVMVLLEGEVKELADAQVYLDPANERGPTAVDLLLGTQGWRRFAFIELAKFAAVQGDKARRVLALKPAHIEPPRPQWAAAGLGPASEKAHGPGQGGPAVRLPAARVKTRRTQAGRSQGRAAKNQANADAEAPADIQLGKRPNDLACRRYKGGEGKRFAAALGSRGKWAGDEELWAGEALAVRNDFVPVRIYAHQVRSQRQPGDRADFAETLFWSAGIRTDEHGQAVVEFGLNDAVTSFRVFGDAFGDNGALGAESLAIESIAPFYLEPKLPLEVTQGDVIRAPLGIVNATSSPLG